MYGRAGQGTCVALLGILLAMASVTGCAGIPEAPGTTPLSTTTPAFLSCNYPHNGSSALLLEAQRELALMNSSLYTHTTSVNEATGTYNFDCSGFVGYALSRADPCAYGVLLSGMGETEKDPERSVRPLAEDFYRTFIRFGTSPGTGGWLRVPTPEHLRPGDIIAWLKPDSSDSGITGHVLIVAGYPEKNPDRAHEFLISVIDATTSPHTGDTRGLDGTGLGKGIIGIATDDAGNPEGYYWRGGGSPSVQKTEIAFARIA